MTRPAQKCFSKMLCPDFSIQIYLILNFQPASMLAFLFI